MFSDRIPVWVGILVELNERQRAARKHQRGSRNPRPPAALAFWRRYSAYVASARFSSETDFCACAILTASRNEASIWVSSAPIAARNTPRRRHGSADQLRGSNSSTSASASLIALEPWPSADQLDQ